MNHVPNMRIKRMMMTMMIICISKEDGDRFFVMLLSFSTSRVMIEDEHEKRKRRKDWMKRQELMVRRDDHAVDSEKSERRTRVNRNRRQRVKPHQIWRKRSRQSILDSISFVATPLDSSSSPSPSSSWTSSSHPFRRMNQERVDG